MICADGLFIQVTWRNKGVPAVTTYYRYCENIFESYDNIRHRLTSRFISYSKVLLERVVGLNTINKIYERVAGAGDGIEFVRMVIKELDIRYEIDSEDLSNIPITGPVIVVANHPFGGIEGMVLSSLLAEVRSDIKVLANHLLQGFPEFRDLMFFCRSFCQAEFHPAKPPGFKGGGSLGATGGAAHHLSGREGGPSQPAHPGNFRSTLECNLRPDH